MLFTIIILLSIVLMSSALIKASFWPWKGRLAYSLCAAALVFALIPWFTRQSPDSVKAMFTSSATLADMAVCVMIEVLLMIGWCFAADSRYRRILDVFPGVMGILALPLLLAQILYSTAGISFARFSMYSTILTGLAVFVGTSLIAVVSKSRGDIMRETVFILNILAVVLCVAAAGSVTY